MKELLRFTDFPSKKIGVDDLVIYDVDQVIIDPVDRILSAKGDAYKRQKLAELEAHLGEERANYLYSILIEARKVRIVESTFLEVFQALKNLKIPQIALTAFPSGSFGVLEDVATFRQTQLSSLGVDFGPPQERVELLTDRTHRLGRQPLLQAGILYTGQGGLGPQVVTKGEVFTAYIHLQEQRPKTIWFIDDSLAHLQSVQTHCEQLGLDFHGFHYQAASRLAPELDRQMADQQFEHLMAHETWLSDEQVRHRTQSKPA